MSRKPKTTAPQEEARPALVPKLRFPEFRKLAGWPPTPLKSIADPVTERATQGDEDNVLSLSAEHGIVLQSEFFGKKVAGDNSERYLKIARNDFVYNDRTTKASTFGTIKRLSKHSGGIVSPIYKCFRFHADENPVFWEQYFESGYHEAALRGLVNEGARAGRFNISISQFLSTAACRPDEAEQQKIAECLSSVDQLIAAQARKLESLKTHKKGLMQQLFPRAGETQPRLRFPEFQNAGEWEEGTVSDFAEINPRREVLADDVEVSFVPMSVVSEDGFLAEQQIRAYGTVKKGFTAFRDNDVIIAKITPCFENGKAAYVTELTNGVGFGSTEFHVVRTGDACLPEFLFSQLYTEQFRRAGRASMTGSGGQQRVPATFLEQYPIQVPKLPEQHRIAECLSSLDALIAAETHKHAALQRHKRGLMQQLFPSPEEQYTL